MKINSKLDGGTVAMFHVLGCLVFNVTCKKPCIDPSGCKIMKVLIKMGHSMYYFEILEEI